MRLEKRALNVKKSQKVDSTGRRNKTETFLPWKMNIYIFTTRILSKPVINVLPIVRFVQLFELLKNILNKMCLLFFHYSRETRTKRLGNECAPTTRPTLERFTTRRSIRTEGDNFTRFLGQPVEPLRMLRLMEMQGIINKGETSLITPSGTRGSQREKKQASISSFFRHNIRLVNPSRRQKRW